MNSLSQLNLHQCQEASCALAILLAVLAAGLPASAQGLVIADGGKSDFRIVVADGASPSTTYAAAELQKFLKEITGAELPVVPDKQEVAPHEIILGDSSHLRKLGAGIDFAKLGPEGYVLRTAGGHLVIAGGAPRGDLYGVYGLLEDHLGCRWFTPQVSRIPRQAKLVLGPLDETQVPVLEYREPFVIDCFDGDWCARNRVNGTAGHLTQKHGGKVRFGGGLFVHTFNPLLPPEKHFDKHPEYYSQINGKRLKDQTQLCCTNEDVVRLVTEEVRGRMRRDPQGDVFDVSQNDWFNFCTCGACAALARREDSQAAPVLQLVNRVAEAVEKEFPGKAVETLAYQWTRKPPKTIRPRHNVIIRLCSIECCFSHPLSKCNSPENRSFVADMEAWSRIAGRIWVWNYCTSFAHYYTPFPTLRTLAPNVRFFVARGARGIFEQDNYQSPNGELSQLGGYMMAKCLWNPQYDADKAMSEFLEGVYGKAAGPIRQYVDLLHDKAEKDNIHVYIWAAPDAPLLSDEILARSDKLWQQAEDAAAGQADVLERVRFARLSVDYALIERGKGRPDAALARVAERFFTVGRRAGITTMREGRVTLEEYRKTLGSVLK